MGVDGGVDSTEQYLDIRLLDIMSCIKIQTTYAIP